MRFAADDTAFFKHVQRECGGLAQHIGPFRNDRRFQTGWIFVKVFENPAHGQSDVPAFEESGVCVVCLDPGVQKLRKPLFYNVFCPVHPAYSFSG